MKKVLFSHDAVKEIKKLPKTEVKKVMRKIEAILSDVVDGKILKGELSGLLSLRAWPYRIVYFEEDGSIKIVSVKHRQGAYKK